MIAMAGSVVFGVVAGSIGTVIAVHIMEYLERNRDNEE